jgi:hypothetical protein
MGNLISLTETDWSNLGGRGEIDWREESAQSVKKIAKGASGGKDPITIIIGAVVGAIDAGFGWATAGRRAKIDNEKYRQELIGELFEPPKTNWTPIYIVGGVLIVGGIVTYFALRE